MAKRLIFGNAIKQSEKNISIKNGKHPSVSRPNIVLMKLAVIMLMLITEKQVRVPTSKSSGIEPDVLYPTENADKSVRNRQIIPIII